MAAQDKADEELQAARMRELFGECKPETDLIVDMQPEALEPVKQVTIEEDEAMKEKAKMREKQQKMQAQQKGSADSKSSKDVQERGVKQAFSEPELRIEEKDNRDGNADPQRRGYKRMAGGKELEVEQILFQ